MASRKFRFVSPGVFLKEVDQSQLPRAPEGVGPVLIGRTRKGPSMKPYKVRSFQEFERVFGLPMPGNEGEDPWRDGTHLLAESYLPYAAQAYLSADIDSPVTVVRLAGVAGEDATTAGEPGWEATNAYGMFLISLENTAQTTASLDLAAIWYGTDTTFGVKLSGDSTGVGLGAEGAQVTTTASGSVIKPDSEGKFTIRLSSSAGEKDVKFTLADIRANFNTNPVSTNLNISTVVSGTLSHHYWLGETFEESNKKILADTGDGTAQKLGAVILKLADGMDDFRSTKHGLTSARSGWVFGNDTNPDHSKFNPDNQQKLFRLIAIHEGSEASRDLMISIEDMQVPLSGALDRFGKFSVVVKKIMPSGMIELERFDECNLNPDSENHISRRIGDVYYEWDPVEKRNKTYGSNMNISELIRVEMDPSLNNSPPANTETVPFGFYGPIVPKTEISRPQKITLEFTGQPTSDKSITITSGDGTSKTYVGKNVANFAANQFSRDTSATAAATSLAGAINNTAGHKSKLSASVGGATVTIFNAVAGTSTATAKVQSQLNNVTVVTASATLGADNWVIRGGLELSGAAAQGATANIKWAHLPLVNTASLDDIRFGATSYQQNWTSLSQSVETDQTNRGHIDFVRMLPNLDTNSILNDQLDGLAVRGKTEVSHKFTLDDVILQNVSTVPLLANVTGRGDIRAAYYLSGSRKSNDSWSSKCTGSVELRTFLDIVKGFHMPLVGGSDGVDITEANPFNNSTRTLQGKTTANSYAYASVDRAIELIRDSEVVEHNLAAMPGITEEKLTKKLIRTCESRADSLAIIDLPFVYQPPSEKKCETFKDRVNDSRGRVKGASKRLVGRQLNSSYGATYYPWVQIKDDFAGKDVWVPPSVVSLGVMAFTEEKKDVWFAPAGFNRGGLDTGNAGLTVLRTSEQLLSKERDTLYAANINPIAQFVSEGIVIFGQKTLQQTQSALDRINVRRLLIFVKKEISRISKDILFEQNVQVTWTKFKTRAVKFLDEVKVGFGLTDFRVVLDETTTTADLVDRNILYAKVFLKPARSIEFIAVDFVITRSGAAYDD